VRHAGNDADPVSDQRRWIAFEARLHALRARRFVRQTAIFAVSPPCVRRRRKFSANETVAVAGPRGHARDLTRLPVPHADFRPVALRNVWSVPWIKEIDARSPAFCPSSHC
jgi:hypothetical protein